jgi:hypothetical protein
MQPIGDEAAVDVEPIAIVVDLSICGARRRNFLPSPLYNGLSAVESAVNQMATAGVQVVRRIE